jgi:hypothetical protein
MMALADKDGKLLEAGKTTGSMSPSTLPVKEFWALTVDDCATFGYSSQSSCSRHSSALSRGAGLQLQKLVSDRNRLPIAGAQQDSPLFYRATLCSQ